ncbi:hypothetical protein KKB18_12975, partial [bacterium]|nr:hypothetical protein [bacterium]
MRRSIFLGLLLLSVFSVGFRGLPTPGWVASGGVDTDYPLDKYFVGYASSTNKGKIEKKKEAADNMSRENIINQMKSRLDKNSLKIWLESEGISDENFSNRLDLDSIFSKFVNEEY